MGIAESWNRIVAWYETHTWPGKFRLNPGTTPEAIAAFEGEIGARLPEDFRESLLQHDGSPGSWILWYGDLLTLAEIHRQWTMYRDWQAQGHYAIAGSDDWTTEYIDGPIKPIFWNTKRIFVTDNSGDHLTLDLDPPQQGHYGQVFDHCHEVGPRKVLATSLAAFLNQLALDLEAGKYVYVEEVDTVALPGMYN